jgi:hypothetical protein
VKRLRDAAGKNYDPLGHEAADEIARMEARIEELLDANGYTALALAKAEDEIERLRHEARYGTHLIATAKSLGWKNDGEGPQEFLLRRTREVALEDCADEIERLNEEVLRLQVIIVDLDDALTAAKLGEA